MRLAALLIMLPTLASAGIWDDLKILVVGHYDDAMSRINIVHEYVPGDIVSSGTFRNDDKGQDTLHRGSGTVSVVSKDDKTYLQFGKDFTTTPGPNYHVYLSNTPIIEDATNFLASEPHEIARLKRGVGAQFYEISSSGHSVTIWCKRFSKFITSATLEKK